MDFGCCDVMSVHKEFLSKYYNMDVTNIRRIYRSSLLI
jgi:hypothetical protein